MPAPSSTAWLTPELIGRLEALELTTRWVRSGSRLGGRFPINRRGSSIEFSDYNPYTPGDDIRAIDWNLYARLDRLYVRTYKEEIELSVEVMVDATASMGLPSTDKFERARRLGICLGYIALACHHYVRLSWVQPGPVASTEWFHQRRDLWPMAERAERAVVQGHTPLADWMHRAVAALRLRGGQALVITDGMHRPADFFRAMHALLVRNLEVKVIQVLSRDELHPARLMRGGLLYDAETGATHQLAYRASELERAVAEHNEQLARFCRRQGIAFAQHKLEEPLEQFVTHTLPLRGFLK